MGFVGFGVLLFIVGVGTLAHCSLKLKEEEGEGVMPDPHQTLRLIDYGVYMVLGGAVCAIGGVWGVFSG
jgi:hypothetical protein